MRSISSHLNGILQTISVNVQVLPAAGNAVEEMLHLDREESEDDAQSREDKFIDSIVEKPNDKLYVPTPPLPRTEKHLLRYFLDGSIRTWFLGTAIKGELSSPILLAQIGVAVIKRQDDGQLHIFDSNLQHRVLLLLAKDCVPTRVWHALLQTAPAAGIQLVDIVEETSSAQAAADLRLRAPNKTSYGRKLQHTSAQPRS